MKSRWYLLASALLVGSQSGASVRITENSPSRLVFTWELGTLDTASVTDSGRLVTGVSFTGENIMLGETGEAAIPAFSLYAGIPLSGSIRVSFSPGPVRTLHLDHPVRKHRIIGDGGGVSRNRDAIRFSGTWISEPRYTWLRDMRAAHLVIRPFRYEEQSKSLQVLESGVCTIEFPAAGAETAAGAVRGVACDYGRMLARVVLNYDVARRWEKPPRRSLRKALDPFPFTTGQELRMFKIGDGHGGMNEVTIKENGIVKLPGSQIKTLFSGQGDIGISEVALYGSWKGALPEKCPEVDSIPAGVIELPLLRVDRNGNSKVDLDDYFLAYVTGLSDWRYDAQHHDFEFKIDEYDDNRTYWLTLKKAGDGLRMSRFVQPAAYQGTDTVGYFTNRVMFREPNLRPEKFNRNGVPDFWDVKGFVWIRLSYKNREDSFRLDLPNVDTAAGGALRFTMFCHSALSAGATIAGGALCTNCSSGRDYPVERWGDRLLVLTNASNYKNDYWQLASIRASYRHPLSAAADTVRMHVFSATDTGVGTRIVRYRLSGIGSGGAAIFRIPPDEGSIALVDTVSGGGAYGWADTVNCGARYFVCNAAAYRTLPDSAFSLPPKRLGSRSGDVISQLRDTRNESDYLIVTHPDFLSEAQRLADHKKAIGFSKPRIVGIGDIYLDFAGGNVDPAAIRNFLAFAKRNWKGPSGLELDYAVLMGSGHYDYKNIKTSEYDYLPPVLFPCIEGNFPNDDFFAYLSPGEFGKESDFAIAIGRLPCREKSEAAVLIGKIKAMENEGEADWGAWRNRMLFVADDDMQGKDDDLIPTHYKSSEETATIVEGLRPWMELRKTYLYEYEWTADRKKPGASRALINEINNGVGYVNFFGHGSEGQWTDEVILTEDILGQCTNNKRYPIITSFSCSVGKFDTPDKVSLGETMALLHNAGAIASFASTRGAGAPSNEALGKDLYGALFDTTQNVSIGMAVLEAKILNHNANDWFYVLFGDPSIRIVAPERRLRLSIDTAGGGTSDTLKALQKITIKGSVVDKNGAIDASFGVASPAYVQFGLFNAPELASRKDGGKHAVQYLLPGKPVFSGTVAVRGGVFEQPAALPLNLSFDKSGVKLLAYAWERAKIASGSRTGFVFHGSVPPDEQTKADSAGPRIAIRPLYEVESMQSGETSFSDRIVSSLPLSCEIVLDDPGGINVNSGGPDEGLTMEVPGILSRRSINHKFQFAQGSCNKGSATVVFEEQSLALGSHDLVITAQDLLGNVSRASFVVEITDKEELRLDHVFNAPNPMRMGKSTRFFFYPSTVSTWQQAQAVVKIYAMNGKLFRVIKDARNGEEWDGCDQTGRRLPPNMYLYQVMVDLPVEGRQVKSKIQKLVIHPPG